MKLTERQCWKIVRQLVTDKNVEYKQFLKTVFDFSREPENFGKFDTEQLKQIQGYTRDEFLFKCGFISLESFNQYVQDVNPRGVNSRWLENLSSADLILFLDFRCRILQSMYNYYKQYHQLEKADIKNIVRGTELNELSRRKRYKLECVGKPARLQGEAKLADLGMSESEMAELAIAQVLGSMAGEYVANKKGKIEEAEKYANQVKTSNIDYDGKLTGHQLKGKVKSILMPAQDKLKFVDERVDNGEYKTVFVGYDANKNKVFMRGNDYVSFIGVKVSPVKIVYDREGNLIQNSSQGANELEEDCQLDVEHVGKNIHGTPVYEYKGEYYSSLGEPVRYDEYIDTTGDDWKL